MNMNSSHEPGTQQTLVCFKKKSQKMEARSWNALKDRSCWTEPEWPLLGSSWRGFTPPPTVPETPPPNTHKSLLGKHGDQSLDFKISNKVG